MLTLTILIVHWYSQLGPQATINVAPIRQQRKKTHMDGGMTLHSLRSTFTFCLCICVFHYYPVIVYKPWFLNSMLRSLVRVNTSQNTDNLGVFLTACSGKHRISIIMVVFFHLRSIGISSSTKMALDKLKGNMTSMFSPLSYSSFRWINQCLEMRGCVW